MSADLLRRRGVYGVDAPYVPVLLGSGGLVLLVVANLASSGPGFVFPMIGAVWMLLSTASYLYTTRAGKFGVWAGLLRNLGLSGEERVLDMGCGRGAVLLMATKLVPRGKGVGVDLWKTSDQSGNSLETTRRNAELEGVAERVELQTADMRSLPFPDASFDLVVSSLAVHNITGREERLKAIDEMVRVLKPGGRVLVADFRRTSEYADRLRERGIQAVRERGLGWRFWYGGPWTATRLVSAAKPA